MQFTPEAESEPLSAPLSRCVLLISPFTLSSREAGLTPFMSLKLFEGKKNWGVLTLTCCRIHNASVL